MARVLNAASGDLDEAPAGESALGGSAGENLRQNLDRIARAKADPKVKALVLEVHDLQLGLFGFGKVQEVRGAIADFRKSGKKAYAYVEEVGGLDYLIACACDQVYVPEGGSFGLTGLHLEMSFYKNLLDKVHVKGDFLTMGEAKGAVEPYTRTEMGVENKKQYTRLVERAYVRCSPVRVKRVRSTVYAGNNILVRDDGTIAGVLDWEAARLGDPLWELARTQIAAFSDTPSEYDRFFAAYERHIPLAVDAGRVARYRFLMAMGDLRYAVRHAPALIPERAAHVTRCWRQLVEAPGWS